MHSNSFSVKEWVAASAPNLSNRDSLMPCFGQSQSDDGRSSSHREAGRYGPHPGRGLRAGDGEGYRELPRDIGWSPEVREETASTYPRGIGTP